MLAKAQVSAQAISEYQNGSPSPTTILKTVNNSGNYMCSQHKTNLEMPSPQVIYREASRNNPTIPLRQNMMQHRNNHLTQQQDNSNQFDYDESDENSSQHHQAQQFPPYINNNYNYSQTQHSTMIETQQQADQYTIERRMNNLGNENSG